MWLIVLVFCYIYISECINVLFVFLCVCVNTFMCDIIGVIFSYIYLFVCVFVIENKTFFIDVMNIKHCHSVYLTMILWYPAGDYLSVYIFLCLLSVLGCMYMFSYFCLFACVFLWLFVCLFVCVVVLILLFMCKFYSFVLKCVFEFVFVHEFVCFFKCLKDFISLCISECFYFLSMFVCK